MRGACLIMCKNFLQPLIPLLHFRILFVLESSDEVLEVRVSCLSDNHSSNLILPLHDLLQPPLAASDEDLGDRLAPLDTSLNQLIKHGPVSIHSHYAHLHFLVSTAEQVRSIGAGVEGVGGECGL